MKERPSINHKTLVHTILHTHSTLSSCTISTTYCCASCTFLWHFIRYWNETKQHHSIKCVDNTQPYLFFMDTDPLLPNFKSTHNTWQGKQHYSSSWQLPWHNNTHRQLCMSTGAAVHSAVPGDEILDFRNVQNLKRTTHHEHCLRDVGNTLPERGTPT